MFRRLPAEQHADPDLARRFGWFGRIGLFQFICHSV
jgi:hypothetical protein